MKKRNKKRGKKGSSGLGGRTLDLESLCCIRNKVKLAVQTPLGRRH